MTYLVALLEALFAGRRADAPAVLLEARLDMSRDASAFAVATDTAR